MTFFVPFSISPALKFSFIALCLVIALLSGLQCRDKRDWAWLCCGLGFTVLADYLLVLRHEYFLGVAAFCFVHVCYILRAAGFRRWLLAVPLAWGAAFLSGLVVVLAGVYACLFAVNIYVNRKTRLILAGLILFALCDINVMLANLPRYLGTGEVFPRAYTLIWVFYLPSQFLLAISAKGPKLVNQKI